MKTRLGAFQVGARRSTHPVKTEGLEEWQGEALTYTEERRRETRGTKTRDLAQTFITVPSLRPGKEERHKKKKAPSQVNC